MSLLVSIIIPAFNAESYISACLDSIVYQIDKTIEVIIINDGSTDSTGTIADSYALTYNFIKVIHQSNEGVSAARNMAIASSAGQYLVFLDSDDVLHNCFFQKIFELITQHPDIIEINANLINYEGKLLDSNVFLLDDGHNSFNNAEIAKKRLSKQSKYYLCSRIIRRELVEDLSFDENIRFCEDALYLTECYFKANKIVTINESLYGYRQHDTNVTVAESIQNINELTNLCNIVKDKIGSSQDNEYRAFLLSLLVNMTHLRKSMYALKFKKLACDHITTDHIKDIKEHYIWGRISPHNDVAWIRRFSIIFPRLSNSMILLKSHIKGN